MRVQISGKITGLDEQYVNDKFAKSEGRLRSAGHDVINPLDITSHLPKDASWTDYMRICLTDLLLLSDAICMQDDWQDSKGARVEHKVACAVGLEVLYE